MRDQMDDRLWVANHEELGRAVGGLAAGLRRGLERLASWDGTTPHLLAMIAALAVTGLGFSSTAAA